jgi:hypothetical protein
VDRTTASFTPDITSLILAAHRNNYEILKILKILLDRGATLPMPHDVREVDLLTSNTINVNELAVTHSVSSFRREIFLGIVNWWPSCSSPDKHEQTTLQFCTCFQFESIANSQWRYLVRRIARIPAEESDPEAGGSVSDRLVVPRLLPAVHSDTRKFPFSAHEEAFHEILDPRIVLLVLLA